jgi:hypothetical protein
MNDLKKKFAIVKLWSELKIKNAEDECIARLKYAAKKDGIDVVEIHPDGRYIEDTSKLIGPNDVDFVLHLHYQTPKAYDAYSIVALWNPVNFYIKWGYENNSRNLLSHDDFISCGSFAADAMVKRRIKATPYNAGEFLKLYHSVYDIVHPPSLGNKKLFYAGINWEALGGPGNSRHGELLKILEKTGKLNIYGPKIFLGVDVWADFKCYKHEIPFDGISMIDEISKSGVSLVLSSQDHKDSSLMSSRLFESIAAGSLVIVDENSFAKDNFGDCLLYIDSTQGANNTATQIINHLEWAENNEKEALKKIQKAQNIFRDKYSHKTNIRDIYSKILERKKANGWGDAIDDLYPRTAIFYLLPSYDGKYIENHFCSITANGYQAGKHIFCISQDWDIDLKNRFIEKLNKKNIQADLIEVFDKSNQSCLGGAINNILEKSDDIDAFIIVAPNERLFSNHVNTLVKKLISDRNIAVAATAAIIKIDNNEIRDVHDIINFGHCDPLAPTGFGRFIFRKSLLPDNIHFALPLLHGRPLAALVGRNEIHQLSPSTIIIDNSESFPARTWNEALENEIIREFSPESFRVLNGLKPIPNLGPPSPAIPFQGPGTNTDKSFLRRLVKKNKITYKTVKKIKIIFSAFK